MKIIITGATGMVGEGVLFECLQNENISQVLIVKWFFRPIIWIFPHVLPSQSLNLSEVGKAMINTVVKGYPKQLLEIQDIKELAK